MTPRAITADVILDPRAAGERIALHMSGRELCLLRAGMAELLNQIDDDLLIIIGTDRGTLRSVSGGLAEVWATLDLSERPKLTLPGDA